MIEVAHHPDTLARLLRLLDQLTVDQPELADTEVTVASRIERLSKRVEAGRFQLAIVGQFKRGKSTLLNAILGVDALPTGVVPLTAIPTSIAYGDQARLEVDFTDRPTERHAPGSIDELREKVAEFVTETGNPHNRQHVAAVRLSLPVPLLSDGLVVIDTPGIGSTERHNSNAALAALPECDAAIMVLSPDPPITEAEIAYLALIKQHAARIIPVLNKSDLVTSAERQTIGDYVMAILSKSGIEEPLSAVAARGTPVFGIVELRSRIQSLWQERSWLLAQAAILKTKADLSELAFQNDIARAAMKLPVEALDEKLAAIREGVDKIMEQQRVAGDLMAGERQRLRNFIDEEAAGIRQRAQNHLRQILDPTIDSSHDRRAFTVIAAASTRFFEDAYRELTQVVRIRLDAAAERARDRILPTLERMRQIAIDALDVRFVVPAVTIELKAPRELAWIERQAETMNPLPTGLTDGLLPSAWRDARRRRRLLQEVERITTQNTENLRWTLRQQAEDILRGFDRELDRQLEDAGRSIMGLARQAREVRSGAAEAAAQQIAARDRRAALLGTAATIA
ncbi:dynamin family protein [Sphingomonas sp. H39-1-10]|uniref:dynamin family protein n=1 Tax=Sphingomonas pollutisoli TaxID=3030829 RepID=UPI0023B992A8|nr:dynamin family protein [Sphingomonas pollutisoli]MDF0490520.1 dynamin family protein [Sphingomonas pollutisoli]